MKKIYIWLCCIGALFLIVLAFGTAFLLQIQQGFTAEMLGIGTIQSEMDADGDGIDDYTDLMCSAREYIETCPVYKSKYYVGGYPDDQYGVCTDVIWQAFAGAGYSLKDLVDADIALHNELYPDAIPMDSNIDFRRVRNLNVFFERYAETLTCALDDPTQWQAGDIVVFDGHIGICSDRRSAAGIPFLIHHTSRGVREANDIPRYAAQGILLAHYRWTK